MIINANINPGLCKSATYDLVLNQTLGFDNMFVSFDLYIYWSYKLEELSFAYFFVVTIKKITSFGTNMLLKNILPFFHPNQNFKCLFSLCSYFRNLFVKYPSNQFEELSYRLLLVVCRTNSLILFQERGNGIKVPPLPLR